MKHAEQVTFGGGALNRAAHIRTDADALDQAWGDPQAQVLLMWRGKPLAQHDTCAEADALPEGLGWTAPTHPLAADRRASALFLGLTPDGAPRFACELDGWHPEGLDDDALRQFFDASEQHHPALPDTHVFAELRRIMTCLTPLDAELATTAKALLAWHKSHQFCACCGHPSDMAQAGWQRVCPSCKAPHFPRTDPVVIMLITHGDNVLMGRSPGWPEGMYSLLAGFVEPGETLEAAVRRETLEETGIKVGAVNYLASQPWAFPMSLMFGCIGAAQSRDITIDPAEIEDALWVSRQEMMTVFAGEHPVMKAARKGAIAHFLLKNWLADTLD